MAHLLVLGDLMPMPTWWGQINKRVFNPRAIASGRWPVLTHVGRISGATYHTPLDAHPVEDGYLFVLVYGSRADWVRNVLATRRAQLRIAGREMALANPRLVCEDEALRSIPDEVGRPPRILRITEFLRMDLVAD